MQVDVEQRGPGSGGGAAQCRLDVVNVVETLGPIKIHDEMHAGAAYPVPDYEVIVPCFGANRRSRRER
jgi:hypothetical protein